MVERRRGLLFFGAAFVVLFLVLAISEGIGDPSVGSGNVALVEEVPDDSGAISEAEFEHALELAAAQSGMKEVPKPSDDQYEGLRETALNGLFDMAWIEGLGAEMGISVTDKEVADELKKLKKENFPTDAAYKKFLEESGYTTADVDDRVRLQILSTEIQGKITEGAPKPSESQVEAYYEEAKDAQFTQKASRDVRVILNKDEKKAEEAKALLEEDDSAKNWKKVAKKYSEDPVTKSNGGLQQGLAEGTAEEPLNAAVFETPEDRVEGPIESERGFYVFEVENTTPESVQPLEDVKEQIESQLGQQAEQDTFARFIANYTSTWQSRTFCASDYTIERCSNFEGGGRPAGAPPGCYEEDPEGGPPEACPAPVSQLIPALPGSVSLLEPRGKPLAQRPQPAGLKPAEEAEAPGTLPITP